MASWMLLGMFLGACASPTDYEPASVWNGEHGYRDRRIGPDEYSVVVHANAHTTQKRAARIALLRAAHLTLENGRTHFELVDDASATRSQDVMAPIPVSGGAGILFVPVGLGTAAEPVAVLLIRLVPEEAAPLDAHIDARALVTSLEAELG